MEKYALQNAVRHGGRAEVGAVVSKVLGDSPALRSMAKDVARASAEVVKAVNALTVQQQEQSLTNPTADALLGGFLHQHQQNYQKRHDYVDHRQNYDQKAHLNYLNSFIT